MESSPMATPTSRAVKRDSTAMRRLRIFRLRRASARCRRGPSECLPAVRSDPCGNVSSGRFVSSGIANRKVVLQSRPVRERGAPLIEPGLHHPAMSSATAPGGRLACPQSRSPRASCREYSRPCIDEIPTTAMPLWPPRSTQCLSSPAEVAVKSRNSDGHSSEWCLWLVCDFITKTWWNSASQELLRRL
jgi:hypothetical protein